MAADTTVAATARPGAVLAFVLRGQRRALVLWGIAVAAVSAIYQGFYPAIGDDQMEDMAQMLPEDLAAALGYDQLTDAAGYLTATVFGLLGPALLLVFAIGVGARLLAGEEEDGSLELELAHPVARRSIYTERLGALWVDLIVLTLVLGIVVTLLAAGLDMDVGLGGIVGGVVGLLLLAGVHGTVALAAGAVSGRRGLAVATGAGLAVGGYIANAIGPMVGADWLTAISPWAWYLDGEPVRQGIDAGRFSLLLLLAIVAAGLGFVRYGRRDLGV